MSAAGFDSLAVADDLEAHGFKRDQARALANAIRSGQGELATKTDLTALESRLTNKLAALESRLTNEHATLESRLTDKLASQQRWYVGLLFAVAGLAVAAMKLL